MSQRKPKGKIPRNSSDGCLIRGALAVEDLRKAIRTLPADRQEAVWAAVGELRDIEMRLGGYKAIKAALWQVANALPPQASPAQHAAIKQRVRDNSTGAATR